MSILVAKRYVKALLDGQSNENVLSIYNEIKDIASAYSDDNFISIVSSTDVPVDSKVELICSFVDGSSDKLKNLIKLLAEKKRLNLVPDIANELKKEISQLNNSYEGIVYTNSKLSDSELNTICSQFAKKFEITLVLTQMICDYDGIKIDIEGLGVEIGFSKDRFKSQMINHILRAV